MLPAQSLLLYLLFTRAYYPTITFLKMTGAGHYLFGEPPDWAIHFANIPILPKRNEDTGNPARNHKPEPANTTTKKRYTKDAPSRYIEATQQVPKDFK